MIIVVFLFLFVSTIPIASGYFQAVTTAESANITKTAAIAENFVIYRYAVLNYIENHQSQTGVISDDILKLPPNFVKLGGWTNKVQGGYIVVYSTGKVGLLSSNILAKSNAVDSVVNYTSNGRIISPVFGDRGTSFAFVPDGSLISVIQQY